MGDTLFDSNDDDDADRTHNEPVAVTVDGTDQLVHGQTTAADLKQREDVSSDGQLTYRSGDSLQSIPDDDYVLKHVRPGATLTVQPVKGDIFGAPAAAPAAVLAPDDCSPASRR